MRFLSLVLVCPLFGGEIESLGRHLFFDKRLSADGTVSCAMCHRPDNAFSDLRKVSRGVNGALGKFNSPSLLNLDKAKRFFWDGRAGSLEEQARGPLLSEIEMGNRVADLEIRLQNIPEYVARFRRVFGDGKIGIDRVVRAISAYERTLSSTTSLYDDWRVGIRYHWTADHEFGRQLFYGKAGCAACHSGKNFTSNELVPGEDGKLWKVPSLREVMRTPPYMHDGSMASLREVLERHQGGRKLNDDERRAILRFLDALSGEYSR